HVARHGDGVRDVALRVDSVDTAFAAATKRGAISIAGPTALAGKHGSVRMASIGAYGETVHSFIERADFRGTFLPGYRRLTGVHGGSVGLRAIDHVVGNVEQGQMERWAA